MIDNNLGFVFFYLGGLFLLAAFVGILARAFLNWIFN
jgi:hypothetical protein